MMLIETRYRRWLSKQPPEEVVGIGGDADWCPIAWWLEKDLQRWVAIVWMALTWDDARGRHHETPLPDWAEGLEEWFEHLAWLADRKDYEVTAAMVLQYFATRDAVGRYALPEDADFARSIQAWKHPT